MMLEELKQEVLKANQDLIRCGLVTLTWGNVSGIARKKNLIVIKPSGIDYDKLKLNDMVIVDFDGKVVEGKMQPSSDTPTHIELYKKFVDIGGIAHTHSTYATMFAQACKEVPCLGTTHADHFYGPVPVTRFLTKSEVEKNYERSTGAVIIERFKKLNPVDIPGVLVAGHGPFTWGVNAGESVRNGLILERVAEMVLGTYQLNSGTKELRKYIMRKHYERKHGPNAYYGQK